MVSVENLDRISVCGDSVVFLKVYPQTYKNSERWKGVGPVEHKKDRWLMVMGRPVVSSGNESREPDELEIAYAYLPGR